MGLLLIIITLSADFRKSLKIKEVKSLKNQEVESRDRGDIGLDAPDEFTQIREVQKVDFKERESRSKFLTPGKRPPPLFPGSPVLSRSLIFSRSSVSYRSSLFPTPTFMAFEIWILRFPPGRATPSITSRSSLTYCHDSLRTYIVHEFLEFIGFIGFLEFI
jgi:hypothetical protein